MAQMWSIRREAGNPGLDRGWRNTKAVDEYTGASPAYDRRPVEVDEYKGHPVITLPIGARGRFTFGLNKAAALLCYLDEVMTFVESNGGKVDRGRLHELVGDLDPEESEPPF